MAGKGLVLVTGASGFVGKWTTIRLLQAGHAVRGTIRSAAKAEQVRAAARAEAGAAALDRLELVAADILDDRGWAEAMRGVSAVMHVATAIRADEPKDASLVIRPALEGTERVLRFTHAAGIRRFVMTSSIATVGYGHGHARGRHVYDETWFTRFEDMRWTWAYCIGKTRAERATWEFARANGMEVTTIHPGAIIGPALDDDASISIMMVTGLFDNSLPALPRNGFSIVDVRDVADMHVAALEKPEAIGERYLATAEYVPFPRVAEMVQELYPDYRLLRRHVPDWIMFMMAWFGGPVRQIINDIGRETVFDGSKGERLMGHAYIPVRQSLFDTAESGFRLGLVKVDPRRRVKAAGGPALSEG
jgi:nucleoside-diphosphate-sugar epimerase